MKQDIDNMQEQFEIWYSNDGDYPEALQKTPEGNYKLMQAASAWVAWQAAWQTAKPGRWIKTADQLPLPADGKRYEYIDCYIYLNGKVLERPYNTAHECWDDENYDDFFCGSLAPTHWMLKPAPPEAPND